MSRGYQSSSLELNRTGKRRRVIPLFFRVPIQFVIVSANEKKLIVFSHFLNLFIFSCVFLRSSTHRGDFATEHAMAGSAEVVRSRLRGTGLEQLPETRDLQTESDY